MITSEIRIAGYKISDKLYDGVRTIVYRGYREADSLPIVIKVLNKYYPSFSELVQFRNQYTIAKNLDSPLIIQIYSLEPYENSYMLVMEDFGGISLKDYCTQENRLLSIPEFLEIAISLSDALDFLYRHDVIHKDIKPANILINPATKQVKLIDFSIASLLPKENQSLRNSQVLAGTLSYLSPEQTGRMNRVVDYRTDFYSLGVTFYELLTGILPFQSDDVMELVHCHLARTPIPVSHIQAEIPQILSDIINKLMAKNAEDRYQSALGLKHDLVTCLEQIRETGKIIDFKIAQKDIGDRFTIPEKLYGREQEVKQLLETFARVANPIESTGVELMLVAGFSGIGKTAVINEIHKPIVKQRGYFLTGKFDQFNRNIPFSGFVQAFRDLIRQLITENEVQIEEWKSKILQVLGADGQVMIDVIPELEIIIGQQPPARELSGTESENRFNLLLTRFLQVFANKEHTLVIFLDDLQWADSASLKLIKLLMCEVNQGYLLLIGAYRDNEVSPAHPLMLTLDEVRKTGATVNTIILRPLSQSEVNQLVADTLKCVQDLAFSFSKLVYQKTQGNPFFTIQVLKSLHQDGLIEFNRNERCWQCDMSQINQQILTDDVVQFMVWQLYKLPKSTQQVLKLAACIGNKFDLKTLSIVSQLSEIEVASALWKALQTIFILPQNEIYKFYIGEKNQKFNSESSDIVVYKFSHDRVQQAAYSLIPKTEKQATHYQIGQLLLKQISPAAREENIFALVNQLNYGTDLITQQSTKDELAQLNLTASRKARTATAYQAASEYASVGLSLLGKKAWKNQHKLILELHELAAEAAYLCGDFPEMEKLIDTVTTETQFLLEQVNVYRIRIQANTSQNKLIEAITIGQQFLQQLGVTFPESPTPQDVAQVMEEIRELIGNRKIEELAHLPIMTDEEKLAIIQVTNSILPPASQAASPLLPLLISLPIKLSIQCGNTSVSAYSYVCYGVILCRILKDIDKGTQFAHLALQVNSQLDDKTIKCKILHVLGLFILHRKLHIKDTLYVSQDAYITGLEVGNLEFSGYGAYCFCLNSFWCGQPLAQLEQDTRAYCFQLAKLNQLKANNYCRLYWQCLLNLLGFGEDPSILSGEAIQEVEFLPQMISANDLYGLYFFYLYKLTFCFWFGEIELAQKYAVECRRYLIGGMGLVVEPIFYFYDALLALASKYSPDSDVESATTLERVIQNQIQLEHWAHYAPMNYQHKVDLVKAEKFRVLGKNYEAGDWYDRAISGAKENNYIHEVALANELAAKFYLNWGKEEIAAGYMQKSYYAYARWGAKAKIDYLAQHYPQLLQPILQQPRINFIPSDTTYSSADTYMMTSSSNTSDALDFRSILKAAQSISSSIDLDKIVTSLTEIILENSGAKKSVLILLEEDIWQVRAITSISHRINSLAQIETILDPQPLNACGDIPNKIINYVINTQQTIVMDNCQTDISGVIGRYFLEHEPKSVLCTPIIHQGYLVGILYLENKLTSGVFTNERLEVIHLLAAQAAISIQNARLYQKAQQALQNLQQAQLKIIQSEKMSALGNLVAGVAHEMNNPLGFISTSLLQAKPTLSDIMEHLKLYQASFPNPPDLILDHAESINLHYSLDDLPKIIDSMIIAGKRLENISTSLRTFSRADQEYKVTFNIHEGIDSTILILKHRLKATKERPEIAIVTTYADLPQIKCFPGQLNQVFMNILANAIDALDESNYGRSFVQLQAHPHKITVKTSATDNQIKISIADNGKGMSEDVKQRIFDHLFTTKGVGKGTGLGLAIAKQIVEETHGGKLSCNSVLGKGTEFMITIPV